MCMCSEVLDGKRQKFQTWRKRRNMFKNPAHRVTSSLRLWGQSGMQRSQLRPLSSSRHCPLCRSPPPPKFMLTLPFLSRNHFLSFQCDWVPWMSRLTKGSLFPGKASTLASCHPCVCGPAYRSIPGSRNRNTQGHWESAHPATLSWPMGTFASYAKTVLVPEPGAPVMLGQWLKLAMTSKKCLQSKITECRAHDHIDSRRTIFQSRDGFKGKE